ncbi:MULTISPECIES: tyrosine-type recombinase/integrase [Metabacillus]|uniref:tyrosine-type recombinase/integrase n=1 Tax=Metabacillus TaxID=2675233 RepID=UPI001F2B61B9|nr:MULTISPECIES: tyrosine-type recombinase/integrase [Metabacillus]MCM3443274.1 site-specific integrase [Metabacillus halosaccharovorans]
MLSENVQHQIYEYARRTWKKRSISIVLLTLETGIKISELTALNKSNLETINGNTYIYVSSGFGVKRKLPISDELYQMNRASIKQNPEHPDALFVSNHGVRIGIRAVHSSLRNFGISSQVLRDTYIFNLIEEDVDTYEIAQLAGLHITDGLIKKFYSESLILQDEFIEIAN